MEGIEDLQQAAALRTSQSNDVCHYSLYFPAPQASTSRTPASIESLQATTATILEYAQHLCNSAQPDGGYIWQREPFKLHPATDVLPSALAGVSCLQGSTSVGESVEDEWWIVWLLREISKRWTDAVIEVHDSDGQFLLIEAAEALPGWLNPDNADNRLWMNAGNLHLIPLDSSQNGAGHLSLATALNAMFDTSKRKSTVISEPVSKAIWSRTSTVYNAVKTEHSHRTIAYLPDEIIHILQHEPSLITNAVATFYERDAIQLKACQYMRRFRPAPAHYATVRMTRALYAQLASQRFYPPKPFERAGWLTVPENEDPTSPQGIESRRRDIGLKIACGFEMLYQEEKSSMARQRRSDSSNVQIERTGTERSRNQDIATARTSASRHLSQNQAYLKYIVALTESGYFQGESSGSTLYNQLEARAKTYWQDMQDDRADQGHNLSEKLDELLESTAKDPMPSPQTLHEDPDTWLYIDESRLEEMLKGKPERVEDNAKADFEKTPSSYTQEEQDEQMAQEQAQRLQGMANKFSSFLSGEGNFEGAMFEDEAFSDDDDGTDSEIEDDTVAGPQMPMKDKQKRLEKLVPGLADGEWGSAAANAARLAAKRKDDAERASSSSGLDPSGTLNETGKPRGPTRADMQSAGLTPVEKYDGDDSGDEIFEEEKAAENHDAASRPRMLNTTNMEELSDEEDAQLDFGDGEQEEFLKFAREALGLSEEQYAEIIRSRKQRGAFVPEPKQNASDTTELPHKKKPVVIETPVRNKEKTIEEKPESFGTAQQPNSRLDSFETLMTAMDNELSKAKQASKAKSNGVENKTAQTGRMAVDSESESDAEDFNMEDVDAELAAALKRDESDSDPADYTMIKNFLESFQSQNGLAGPVSNIFGRLDEDFSMPRDK